MIKKSLMLVFISILTLSLVTWNINSGSDKDKNQRTMKSLR